MVFIVNLFTFMFNLFKTEGREEKERALSPVGWFMT